MLRESYPYFLAGKAVASGATLPVQSKYTNEIATRVAAADPQAVDQAIAAAAAAAPAMRKLPAFARAEVLLKIADGIRTRRDEFAHTLAIEVGKPIAHARLEADRAVDTFRIAAEEATRLYGDYEPLDITARNAGFASISMRVPVGPCAFITPFNFPLNLAAHKVAPALAAGCPFILKPASTTPVTALLLGEILAATDLPRGAFSILPMSSATSAPLVTDPRIKLLSFTGSPAVGWELKARAGRKRVALELGGNAACIVDADSDSDRVAERVAFGAFFQAGQSCISVQRVYLHTKIYESMKARLLAASAKFKPGDPLDDKTLLGPLISEGDARRVEEWVSEARARGARVLCGGRRQGSFYEPTLLESVPRDCWVSCREVFGPVAVLSPFERISEAVALANDSDFGLQAGIFTRDLHHAHYAFHEIEVGAVVVNDIPGVRVESMPYGGVKDSGFGREGLRFAIEEMTEIRLMLMKGAGSDLL